MIFFYKESKSKKKRGGKVDGRTDEEQAQTNLPRQLLWSWGITMHKCTRYVPDKLNYDHLII